MSYEGPSPFFDSIGLSGVSSPPSSPTSGVIIYHTTSGLVGHDGSEWKKLDIGTLSGLLDVNVAGAVLNDALMYNGSEWIPSGGFPQSWDELSDTSGTPSSGQYIAYNGSFYVPSGITLGPTSISGLDDVSISGLSNGDYLVYNSGTSSFENTSPSVALDDLTDVTLTSPATNSMLQYNGSVWIDSSDTIPGGDSNLILEFDNDATGGYISGVKASGDLNSHNSWFFVFTEATLETASRMIQFRFADGGTDRSTLYDNSYRRRTVTSSADSNAATSNDSAVDCGGGVAWSATYRGLIYGYLNRYNDGSNGLWSGRIITHVSVGTYITETIFNWDADQTIDSIKLYSTTTGSTTESGRLKGRLRLYKVVI